MGKLANMEYAKLDNLIAEHGKDFILKQVITRMADGDNPKDIARSFGIHYVYLKKWVEENAADDVALAKRAHSDVLISNALNAVENAQIEDVAVARLKADTYMKVASKQDKVAWGDGQQVSGGGGAITIVIGSVVGIESKEDIEDAQVIDHTEAV